MSRCRYLAAVLVCSIVLVACVGSGNTGQQGVLARGSVVGSGDAWAFRVWLDDGLLCLELQGGGSCFEVPDGNELLYAAGVSGDVAVDDAAEGFTCVDGAVAKEVEQVSVEFTNGVMLDAQMISGHGWKVDFYALCIDSPAALGQLTLLDEQGDVLLRSE